ncbi:Uncharacterised protein [Actinobacillus pleuropneumoniae]|nr:Uncharacterised protein [Actinobacillus pleuropneumoniae]
MSKDKQNIEQTEDVVKRLLPLSKKLIHLSRNL